MSQVRILSPRPLISLEFFVITTDDMNRWASQVVLWLDHLLCAEPLPF
jgi:hypothetical protein